VVTLDVHMPQMGGLECLDRIMIERPCPVVMVSSLTREEAEETLKAFQLGAVDFVAKPGGAVSLRMAEWAPQLMAKVRGAAGARIRTSHRLRERVRHRVGAVPPTLLPIPGARKPRALGDGLVLIGTSTGGPPALEAVLTALPARFPWPILIAQHMPASFTGALAQRLDRICALEVVEVSATTGLEPGRAYVARGDADMVVSRRHGALTASSVPAQANYPWHPSADRLVRSAMEHVAASQLIGILMTGMGSDGAPAMALLNRDGGCTIAESEQTAVVWGMPGELVKVGGADWVESLADIAPRLESLVPCR
jgi:two-component system chemotaxis response regulator CheB